MTSTQLEAFRLDFARAVYGSSEWLSQHPADANDDAAAIAVAYGTDSLTVTIETPLAKGRGPRAGRRAAPPAPRSASTLRGGDLGRTVEVYLPLPPEAFRPELRPLSMEED